MFDQRWFSNQLEFETRIKKIIDNTQKYRIINFKKNVEFVFVMIRTENM